MPLLRKRKRFLELRTHAMIFIDFNGRQYSSGGLINFAKEQWQECYRQGDYYFIQDYPKIKNAKIALAFLNNLFETDERKMSFKRIK